MRLPGSRFAYSAFGRVMTAGGGPPSGQMKVEAVSQNCGNLQVIVSNICCHTLRLSLGRRVDRRGRSVPSPWFEAEMHLQTILALYRRRSFYFFNSTLHIHRGLFVTCYLIWRVVSDSWGRHDRARIYYSGNSPNEWNRRLRSICQCSETKESSGWIAWERNLQDTRRHRWQQRFHI